MKKLFIVFIAVITAAMLAACTGGAAQQPQSSTVVQPENSAAEQQPSADAQVSTAVETSEAPAAAGIIEPEQLISKEEAAQLVGPVADGEKSEQAAVRQKKIVYNTADGEAFLQVSLSQDTFATDVDHTSADIYTTMKEGLGGSSTETVEGIGDEYFFGTPGLHILYKGYYIVIAAGNSSDPAVVEILKQAGALAIRHLGEILGG